MSSGSRRLMSVDARVELGSTTVSITPAESNTTQKFSSCKGGRMFSGLRPGVVIAGTFRGGIHETKRLDGCDPGHCRRVRTCRGGAERYWEQPQSDWRQLRKDDHYHGMSAEWQRRRDRDFWDVRRIHKCGLVSQRERLNDWRQLHPDERDGKWFARILRRHGLEFRSDHWIYLGFGRIGDNRQDERRHGSHRKREQR
jgi:hypothetical protein